MHLPVRNGTQDTNTNADTMANAIALSTKRPLVSDPGVSCLLLASMKLGQADMLADTRVDVLDPSVFDNVIKQ